jgi:hypothetical protein
MIKTIEFDQTSMEAGEVRVLRAWATDPLFVQIECFRQPPQPPQLRPCRECGSFPLREGEPLKVAASVDVFAERGGFLSITVADASGDRRTMRVTVTPTSYSSSSGSSSAMSR